VCPYNFFRSGGVQSHIEFLSNELRNRGHEVKVIAPGVEGIKNNRDDVILLGSSLKVSINRTQGELSVAGRNLNGFIEEMLEREKFDILHFHEPEMPILPIQVLLKSNSINIATFHAALPKTIVGKSIEMASMAFIESIVDRLDGIIAVSEVPAKRLSKMYKGRINIIPNGIDLRVFNTKNRPFEEYLDGKVNILFLGRLDKRKGVIYLVKAFRKLQKEFGNVRLIIAGKGDESKKLESYVKKHKLDNIKLLGFVKEEDKPRLYASCDIFCSPALYGESLGIVLLEAMATGKSVVAYANPGYKTVLKNRGSLFLVKPKNIKGLKEKLLVLSKDRELRNFMGRWGIGEVKNYSWTKVTNEIISLYSKSLNSKRGMEGNVEQKQSNLKRLVFRLKKIFNNV